MDGLQAQTVILPLNCNFRRFGLTKSIIANDRSCFRSQQFRSFCQSIEIEHPLPTTINGMAVPTGLLKPLHRYSRNAAQRLKLPLLWLHIMTRHNPGSAISCRAVL